MTRYLLARFASTVPVWVGISLLAFGLSALTPGDPATIILLRQTGEPPSVEAVRIVRRQLRLDDPFPARYGRWLLRAVQGDLGQSYRTGEPVLASLASRFPRTLAIAATAMAMALAVSLPLGVATAMFRGSGLDHGVRIATLLVASLPSFWLGYLLILLFAVWLHALPVAGSGTARHLVLPALTLAVGVGAGFSRLIRAALLEELWQGYTRTARARGVREILVILRHCLRNASIGLTTVAALRFGHLLAGAVIVETVFAWPGIGSFMVDAIYDRDYPVIQGFVLFTGTVFLALSLLADLAYSWLDPRIRLTRGGGDAVA
ncbi:MAG: ABC transporter permease [Gemmatimonadales bacterium]|nr:ABC transporter permease [Gemmatimonadales bacterium]